MSHRAIDTRSLAPHEARASKPGPQTTRPALHALGVAFVVAFFGLAIVGPLLPIFDPRTIDLFHAYELPSARHLLGTGDNGIDLLAVLCHGARLAGVVGLWVTGISLLVGGTIGTVAGYVGGALDHAVGAAADLLQAFPALVLNIAILALVARPGLTHLVLALSAHGWVLFARLARAQAFALRHAEYVVAARALGMHPIALLARHVVPNLLSPLIIQATAGFGGVVLAESTLSFLGLGPGVAVSWGALLDQGSAVLLRFPHVALVSAVAIAATVFGFNLTGDFLRDRLDPRHRAGPSRLSKG